MLSVGGLDGTSSQAVEMFHAQDALFAENAGQWENTELPGLPDPSASQAAPGPLAQPVPLQEVFFGYNKGGTQIYFTDESIEFGLSRRELKDGVDPAAVDDLAMAGTEDELYDYSSTSFSLNFDGAQTVVPTGADQAETVFNYHLGPQENWVDGVATYKTIIYDDLYEGIDLHTFSRHGEMKYEFHVAAGSDWSEIQLSYDGIEGLSIGEDGSLRIQTALGPMVDEGLYIYQTIDGEQVEVAGEFTLVDEDTYAFLVTGEYDPSLELVIDPELEWSTYLGGGGEDRALRGVTTDSAGNIYVTGNTESSGWVSGGWDTTYAGYEDGFVVKLSPSGEHLWSSYFGGSHYEGTNCVLTDTEDNVYVAGYTRSSGWISGVWGSSYGGNVDGFVVKLSSSGTPLWSSYLGGTADEVVRGIASDANGDIFVAGFTHSTGWISGGWDTSLGGNQDGYVMKLSSTGEHLWSSYLGGSAGEVANDVATDENGNVCIGGVTLSGGWISAGWNTSYGGNEDGYVAKLSASGQHLWSSYLGGSNKDGTGGVATDSDGNVYVVGGTESGNWTSDGWDTSYAGNSDGYAVRLSPSGDHLWSSYFGGANEEKCYAVGTDAQGNAYAVGSTQTSDWVSGGWDTSYNGGDSDGAIVKFSPTGEHVWSSVLGGANSERISGITVDNARNVYVVGRTSSSDFPAANNEYQGGTNDAFVTRITIRTPDTVSGTLWNDFNGNGTRQDNEPPLTGWTVFLDANNNGEYDDGEYLADTDESGRYRMTDIAEGEYVLTPVLESDWEVTLPAEGTYPVTIDGFTPLPTYDFGIESGAIPRLYVDMDAVPGGLGFSWETAFDSLQTALTLALSRNTDTDPANDVSEIWVAEGMYRPTQRRVEGTARTETFSLVNGVSLVGGFAGTEEAIDEREILEDGTFAHPTILSGDIGTTGNTSDNAYHVVYVAPLVDAAIDGVTIRDGHSYDFGGGIAILSEAVLTACGITVVSNGASVHGGGIGNLGDLVLSDSTISNNASGQAAGIMNWGSLLAENVSFVSNAVYYRDELSDGGAIYNTHQGEAELTSCEFANNSACDGGAIFNQGTITLVESFLTGNRARNDDGTSDAGGIYNEGTATLIDSSLIGNSARDNGGAAYSIGSLSLIGCSIEDNYSERDDCGGVYTNWGHLYIDSSSFVQNHAPDDGGAIWSSKSDTIIVDSRFEGNVSGGQGALMVLSYGTLECTDSVVVGNQAGEGAILWGGYVPTEGVPLTALVKIVNTTMVGNQFPSNGQLISPLDGVFELTNSILALNSPDSEIEMVGTLLANNNLIDVDPQFVRNPSPGPDGNWGTDDDDYGDLRLLEASPALDAGNTALLPSDEFDQDEDGDTSEPLPLDIAGLPRVIGDAVDIGAYELNRAPVVVDETFEIIEDTEFSISDSSLLANDSDPEEMAITLVAVTPGPEFPGTLTWDDGTITFEPETDYTGSAEFTYIVEDALGAQSTGTVHIDVISLPGDLNRDGTVNSRDLDIVRAWWNFEVEPGNLSEGDATGDGRVGSADLDLVRSNWGNSVPTAASAVPATASSMPSRVGAEQTVFGPRRQSDVGSSRECGEGFRNARTLGDAAWSDAVEALRGREKRRERAVDVALSLWE